MTGQFVRICSIPGCLRNATREVRAVQATTGVVAMKRPICDNATCEATARQSLSVRVEVTSL